MPYSQGSDWNRVNHARIGDVLGVPASSRSRISLRQRHLLGEGTRGETHRGLWDDAFRDAIFSIVGATA